MKAILLITTIFIISNVQSQECAEFNYKSTLSGEDFVDFEYNPSMSVCEYNKTINIGSETFYYTTGGKNRYGDFYYPIQEAQGFGWPEIGYVKISADFKSVKLKFMNSEVFYSLLSPYEMSKKEELERIERQIREQERKQEEIRKIEEDKVTKTKVESYLNNNNLNAAITEFNKMYFFDQTLKSRINSEIEKRNLEEDSKRIESIESMLNSNQVDLSVEEFKKLHYNNDNIKQKVQNVINQNYEKQSLVLQTDILNKIISENTNSFMKLNDGQYKIVLIKDGSVSAESKESSSKIAICTNKSYLKKEGFEYPATYSGDVTISTNKTKMNAGDSIRYIVSEKYKKKDIYISRKGEFYLGRFGAPFTAEMCLKPSFYSEDVIENNINLEQLYTYTRIANGIKIEEGKGYFVEKTIVAKKGTGRKIFRIITSPIWGPFYLYFLASR